MHNTGYHLTQIGLESPAVTRICDGQKNGMLRTGSEGKPVAKWLAPLNDMGQNRKCAHKPQAILSSLALRDNIAFVEQHYSMLDWRHAKAILKNEYHAEWVDIVAALAEFRLLRSEVETPGGGKTAIASRLDRFLLDRAWTKKRFETTVVVDGIARDNPTHEIDCYRNRVAVEVEWNNKDPFFDRDLNNFRILFELDAVAVGVIITRADELQDIFNDVGKGSSYGSSTTHWSRLAPRIKGGGSGGCPVLAFGITRDMYIDDVTGKMDERGKR